MGQKYNENHLNALKSCFYEQLKDDDEKLNIGLNVFFNNDPNNSDNWKTSFKQRIIQLREERLESEKVTIERKEISTKNLENIDPKKIIDAGREKWMSIKNSLDDFLKELKKKLRLLKKCNYRRIQIYRVFESRINLLFIRTLNYAHNCYNS